jgi:hypothetical protein
MSLGSWVAARAFDAQVAETGIPAVSSFVSLGGRAQFAEVRLRLTGETGALGTGSTGPSAVTISIWREWGGKVDRVGQLTAPVVSNVVQPVEPLIVEVWASAVYVTVASFVSGTSPTLTGTVDARGLAH